MSQPKQEPAILHIHGQRFPQDLIEIYGTSTGIERLINALIEAINRSRGRAEITVSDGFEAQIQVACLDGARRDEEWKRSGSPYLDLEDPLVARIIILTDEVARLKQNLAQLRNRQSSRNSES